MDEEEFQQNALDEMLLPKVWELNNTARTDSELLFFNRVPKVGSQTFMELLRRLSIRNRFGKFTYIHLVALKLLVKVFVQGNTAISISATKHDL